MLRHLEPPRLFGGCRDTNVLQILAVVAAGGGGGGGSIFGGHLPHWMCYALRWARWYTGDNSLISNEECFMLLHFGPLGRTEEVGIQMSSKFWRRGTAGGGGGVGCFVIGRTFASLELMCFEIQSFPAIWSSDIWSF